MSKKQPPVRAVPTKLTLYPTLDSLYEVVELGRSKLPITDPNTLVILLYTYHNTLLAEIAKSKE